LLREEVLDFTEDEVLFETGEQETSTQMTSAFARARRITFMGPPRYFNRVDGLLIGITHQIFRKTLIFIEISQWFLK
jgi:hypothetical protein